ncbi:hypothetical protein [Chondrinema litorale]|uniref:hypothetical protein n=1 Tax=Chondrinema litorale TaxID=2994555 RepID=UPI0025432B3F|nr:hypothetical protein [Chondrinema litorale]UZR93725.1 hypothetical protein OQ292_17910 [Chondrinema litorale]
MKNCKSILNSNSLETKDLANLLLLSLLLSIFFQFSSLSHHSNIPKEEKEVNEKLEIEESTSRISTTVINRQNGGDSGLGVIYIIINNDVTLLFKSFPTITEISTCSNFVYIQAFTQLYLLFSQLVLYDI